MSGKGNSAGGGGMYSQGKNFTSSGGVFRNGHGKEISDPAPYFDAVGANKHGFNSGYENGHGQPVNNPPAYYKAVGEDRYGYNSK